MPDYSSVRLFIVMGRPHGLPHHEFLEVIRHKHKEDWIWPVFLRNVSNGFLAAPQFVFIKQAKRVFSCLFVPLCPVHDRNLTERAHETGGMHQIGLKCVSPSPCLTAPKGHDNKAQGNALGIAPQSNTSPERARIRIGLSKDGRRWRKTGWLFRPFRAYACLIHFPGRCLGL